MVEVLVNYWDDPKFSRPTDEAGDWHVARSTCFEHANAPTAIKYAIEKMTGQLLQRQPFDITAPVLQYAGTTGAGGHPCTVRLQLVAVAAECHLYRLTSESSVPRRWEEEQRFTSACERRFAHWCVQLRIVANEQAWPNAPRADLEQCVMGVIAAEEATARAIEDKTPVVALQRQVLDALRSGMGFFSASKEGGSHLFFDGSVFRRKDYGDGPDWSAVYADDASMIDGLRRFYDWDARRDSYPHRKPDLEVWQYIHSLLRPR